MKIHGVNFLFRVKSWLNFTVRFEYWLNDNWCLISFYCIILSNKLSKKYRHKNTNLLFNSMACRIISEATGIFWWCVTAQYTPIRHLSLHSLLPETQQYMTYEGSTTHPGCWETTVWIILNRPIYITKQEVTTLPDYPSSILLCIDLILPAYPLKVKQRIKRDKDR